eukprot:1963753-Rhodomonas_salina.1
MDYQPLLLPSMALWPPRMAMTARASRASEQEEDQAVAARASRLGAGHSMHWSRSATVLCTRQTARITMSESWYPLTEFVGPVVDGGGASSDGKGVACIGGGGGASSGGKGCAARASDESRV